MITKIKVPFTKLQHVVAVADIHIRLFKRHQEYVECFEQFYADIAHKQSMGLTNFIIYVGGDIVHAKTDMSPEMVQLASRFLNSLADIAPTIVIAGNHDLNLANTHRLDALTPIIENLNHSNLHYLKRSGVYRIADTDFAVHSILDDRELWPNSSDCTAGTKIALYHGPLYGAKTDTNYTITDRHVNIDTFNGYDIVLLGDIHRYQVLQEADREKKLPVVVYSSSVIQQNHGESASGHGWCLWNIPDRTHEFVELYSKYKYYTLEMVGNKLIFPTNMPENIRLRLFTGNADETVIKKTVSTLRRKYNIIELSVNRTKYTTGVDKVRMDVLSLGDLTSVNVQNNLIQEWLKNSHGTQISDVLLDRVLSINKKLNNELAHEDQSRNVHWRPIQLKFSNIFSYGEDNVISFDDMSGTYGIFAPNASGKSASMDALVFALFDKTPRAFRGDHIMNNRKSNFDIELRFEVDQREYVIHRRGTRKKNGSVKVAVDFFCINPDGSFQSMNGQERSDTNSNIRTLIGTYDDFILTTLSSQTGNSLFIDKSHSERKDLLNQFMGLTIFDKLGNLANEQSKEIHGLLRKFKSDDFTQLLATIQTDLDQLSTEYNQSTNIRDGIVAELEQLDSTINELYHKKLPITGGEIDLMKCIRQRDKLEDELGEIFQEITGLRIDVDRYTTILDSNDPSSFQFREEDEVTAVMDTASIFRNRMSKMDTEISKKSTQIKAIQKQIGWLDGHEYDPNCKFCVNNVFFREALLEQGKLTEYENWLTSYKEQRDILVKQLTGAEETITKYRSQLVQKSSWTARQTELLNAKLILQNTESDKLAREKELLNVNSDILAYHAQEQSLLHNSEIEGVISAHKIKKEDLQQQIVNSSAEIHRLHGQLEVGKSKKDEIMSKLREAVELEMEYEGYKYYMESVGRDGVPYDLITKVIPTIEAEINNILSQIVDFGVLLTVDDKNINGKIVYDYERHWPLENSSGMERFISSLAIRVALMKASNLPKPNFLIIDEGMGTLDPENLASMTNLFSLLKSQFDFVIVISHLDTARDMVDTLIEIKVEDGYSSMKY